MGMFMQSVSFRRPQGKDWEEMASRIGTMLEGYDLDPAKAKLEEEKNYYAVYSPFGDLGSGTSELAQEISAITGDYAIHAECVDSDFNILALYHGGELVDAGCSGSPYEEMEEFGVGGPLHPACWTQLLSDPAQEAALVQALCGEEVLAEDLLRQLTALTGFPVFDDEAFMDWMDE